VRRAASSRLQGIDLGLINKEIPVEQAKRPS
jgi:hypothetical protein